METVSNLVWAVIHCCCSLEKAAKVSIDFSPKEIGLRESTIGIVTEQGERTLRLQGIGQFLKLSPSTVDFGQIAVGETGSQIIELANIGNADLTIDQIRSTSAEFTIYTQMDPANRLVLPANSLRTLPIHVAFSPSSRGTLSGALRIDGFWEEGTETLDVLLNGTGVAAEIEINPTGVVDFGYVVQEKLKSERWSRPTLATRSSKLRHTQKRRKCASIQPRFLWAQGNLRASKYLFRRARWASD